MGCKTRHVGCVQDEYRFYMEDAASKLLLVPASGNKHAEAAASGLNVPVAAMQLRHQGKHDGIAFIEVLVELYSVSLALQGSNKVARICWCLLRPEHDPSCHAGGLKMVLTPKAQGLQLSTDDLRARLSQPPHGEHVALFLHTSGKHLLPYPAIGTESDHVAILALCRHPKILRNDSDERLWCPCMPALPQRILYNMRL